MGLFFNRSNKDVSNNSIEDINEKAPLTAKPQIPMKLNKEKIKDFMIKAVGGILYQSDARERFKRPEYNL